MKSNPYEPTKQPGYPNSGRWRARWKWICLGSLCSVGTFVAINTAYDYFSQNSTSGDLFKIIRGLLALGELASWVMFAVGGIGWILSPRSPSITLSQRGRRL
jgi:hypothetical protein